ncbi:hypothetical protein [Saccharopolyspora kobensis]|uniref:hypothetical protein n=1 Tax=Saccharopolyspora kobensis TaxID=146035 RepID=UPI0011B09379|nr:hypothetical protein [Saccharopolyspora kobensis]
MLIGPHREFVGHRDAELHLGLEEHRIAVVGHELRRQRCAEVVARELDVEPCRGVALDEHELGGGVAAERLLTLGAFHPCREVAELVVELAIVGPIDEQAAGEMPFAGEDGAGGFRGGVEHRVRPP